MSPFNQGYQAAEDGLRPLAPYTLTATEAVAWHQGFRAFWAETCAMPAYDSVTGFLRASGQGVANDL